MAQIIVTAFGVHPDVTQTASPGSPLLEVDWADWAANSPGAQQHDAANISQRGTMGFHAILPGWTQVPPRGHAQPQPTLIEEAFAAMGGGTGPERVNATAVYAAAVATDQLPDGRLRLSGQDRVAPQTPIPYLDRARWHSAMDSLPVHMRAALTMAAEAAQHSVRGSVMSHLSAAENALAGCIARHSLRAGQDTHASALRTQCATIALCEAQLASLHVLLMQQSVGSTLLNEAFSALKRAILALGIPAND